MGYADILLAAPAVGLVLGWQVFDNIALRIAFALIVQTAARRAPAS